MHFKFNIIFISQIKKSELLALVFLFVEKKQVLFLSVMYCVFCLLSKLGKFWLVLDCFFQRAFEKKGNILNDFFCSFVNNPPVLAIRPGFVLQVFYIHSDMFQIMFLLCVGNVCMYVCMYVCMHACMCIYILHILLHVLYFICM